MAEEQKTSDTVEEEKEETGVSEEETTEDKTSEEESENTEDSPEQTSLTQEEIEAELAKEKKARIEAEKAVAESAFKLRESKRKGEEEGEVEEEEKPLTATDLKGILHQDRQETLKEFKGAEIKQKAKDLASSDKEAELMVETHRNRTFPAHLSIDEQMDEVYAIVNRKRLLAQNEELKRKITSKETVTTSEEGDYRETSASTVEAPADVKQQLIDKGFTEDKVKGVFKKVIAGGTRILYHDPKTGKMHSEPVK